MRYPAKIRTPVFLIFGMIALMLSFYLVSMLARGLDPRKDTFFCESMGDIPFVANLSQTWAVNQAIFMCDGETTHSVYLFKYYGFWVRKALILQYTENNYGENYTSTTAINKITWQNDSQLIVNISNTEVQKIILKRASFDNITIHYPSLP